MSSKLSPKKTTKLVRTQILMEPKVLYQIKEESKKQGISMGEFVRQAVATKAKQTTKSKSAKAMALRRKRILSLAGSIHSGGTGDEAKNHNDIYDI